MRLNSQPAAPGPRLLVWTDSFWPRIGGAESWALRLLTSLRERGCEIKVIEVGRSGDTPVDDPFAVVRIPAREALDAGDAGAIAAIRRRCLDEIAAFAPQAVLATAYGAEALALLGLVQSAVKAPLITIVHAEWPAASLARGGLVERLMARSSAVVVFDPIMAEWLEKVAPQLSAKAVTIDQALDDPASPSPRPRTGPVLFCGRLTDQKGGDVAIAAFARVADRFPDLRLEIVGEGLEGPALRGRAAAVTGADRIAFRGALPLTAMPAAMDAASMVLMPSRYEPFGLVALEAAWRARPVIASAVGGLPRIVEDGSTGRLCPADDVDAFAEAIADLIGDPERADRMGLAARGRAEARFNWIEHVNAFEALINRAVREQVRCES